MKPELPENRRLTLEDMFFHEQDRRIIEERAKLQQLEQTKTNLARVSGIRDEALLEKLIALEIGPETLTTLIGIPLIEVAWADGQMDEKERKTLFEYAEKAGLRQKGLDPRIMSAWLKSKPDPALLKAWKQYVQTLCKQLNVHERSALRDEVLADARSVAESAGGILGIGKVSAEEKAMLETLEEAFRT
jgi:DnaJ-domain-containing protein 1